jgi:uncharacterized membrane protein YqhA
MTAPDRLQEQKKQLNTSERSLIRALAWTRYVVAVAVLGIFVGASVLILIAALDMFNAVYSTLFGSVHDPDALRVVLIESVDFFLVATVMYVIAMGLYQLFIDRKVTEHLPHWLQISEFDTLERRLIGMVAVVSSVIFLGMLQEWDGHTSLLDLGLGIGAIIAASSLFIFLGSRSESEEADLEEKIKNPPGDE